MRISRGAPALLLLSGLAVAAPTPTPTPRPRLSGGFGRTPVAAPEGGGQSMADVVRAAGASRARKDQKPVAITNESLVKDPKKGRVSTSAPAPPGRVTPAAAAPAAAAAAAGAVARTPAPALPDTAPAASSTAGDEAAWKERAHAARQRVEELRSEVAQLEADTKQLENDFYRWDDGQYRDRVIKPSWDKKKEDLETRKRELAEAEKALEELPEQARKAGALPGWLRE